MALWMWIAIGILLAINITAFVLFGVDKERALRERQRLPEAHLLWLALFGGAAGAIAGQQFFRHKTRKQPFRTLLIGRRWRTSPWRRWCCRLRCGRA